MKMKKMAAVLSAAAIAVTSLSLTAFAADMTAANDYTGCATDEEKAKYESVVGTDVACTAADGTVTVKINKTKEDVQTALTAADIGHGKTDVLHLVINGVTGTGEFAFTSGYDFDVAEYKEYNYADNKLMLWLSPLNETGTIKYKFGDGAEETLTIKMEYKAAEPVTPTVPDGYFDLGNWASTTVDASTAKAGDKLVIDLANVGANAQLALKSKKTDWPVLPGFAELDNFNSEYSLIDIATTAVKFDYTLTAADIADINAADDKVIVVTGQNACVKASIEASSSGDQNQPIVDDGFELPGNIAAGTEPNIKSVAPSTEAVVTAAPEVVTAANGESVEAAKDVVPAGATLEVKEQTKEDAVKAVEAVKATDANKEVVETIKKAVEEAKAAVVDIDLVKDGQKVQPNGTIKVTLNIPEALKSAANLFVYRVEEDGTFTNVDAKVENGKIVFTTNHFSTYIITSEALSGDAVVTEAPAATEAPATPSNPDDKNQATGAVLAVIPALIAAAGVVVSKKRK